VTIDQQATRLSLFAVAWSMNRIRDKVFPHAVFWWGKARGVTPISKDSSGGRYRFLRVRRCGHLPCGFPWVFQEVKAIDFYPQLRLEGFLAVISAS
jgi:hypothetical protein